MDNVSEKWQGMRQLPRTARTARMGRGSPRNTGKTFREMRMAGSGTVWKRKKEIMLKI